MPRVRQYTQRVIIYGTNEDLGFEILKWILAIDTHDNSEANATVIVPEKMSLSVQEEAVIKDVKARLDSNTKLDAIICVAGRRAGGNLRTGLAGTSEIMWRHTVHSSVIASCLAAHFLKEGGFLLLTGSYDALNASPRNMAHGMAKAAVHHLIKSLGTEGSGMPKESCCVGILLSSLDTFLNRLRMPYKHLLKLTPLHFIANLYYKWSCNEERPKNGSLLCLVTENSETSIVPV
ncbi:hypothetical protein FQA39_LY07197 [Lamprigera yunnana]|nr:hypothetical protein FQA39_LY07197 [Lamprigera yunnana]